MQIKKISFLIIGILVGVFLIINPVKAQAPDPITDLRCIDSGSPGALWLIWSIPGGGAITSYEVKYALSGLDATTYGITYTYSQSWPATATQGMVLNLTQGKYWFFAIKSTGPGGTSAMSNVVWCFLPDRTQETIASVPKSSIIEPLSDSTLIANQSYIIKGESSDVGSSSIQKVEISFDNEETWNETKPIEGTETGFNWEYVWENPVEGIYTIKTKALDWQGNIETPGTGTKVTIVSETPSVEEPPAEEPASEIILSELRARIAEIQQQIIGLLTQLIQILQSKTN